jgi:hypothetical protein
MARVEISIDMNHSAFVDYPNELSRILHDLSERYKHGELNDHPIKDFNGNFVGQTKVIDKEKGK